MNRLLEIIADIAAGRYSSDVMDLTGPDATEPVRTIAEAMGLMMVKVEAREYYLEMLNKQLEEMNQQIRRNTIATVSAMAKTLAARDAYTEGHAERVSRLAGLIAAEMGLSEGETELVELAGLLHDIGKIGFPDCLFLPHEGNNPKAVVREITRHPITGQTARDIPSTSRGTKSRWGQRSLPWPMLSTQLPPTGPIRKLERSTRVLPF
ncbi:MAG: HD domain-containing protein [Verrucomicrobia bacterium]|nr:HD domain-containing protein [Verrucomicrobiota bacterium]